MPRLVVLTFLGLTSVSSYSPCSDLFFTCTSVYFENVCHTGFRTSSEVPVTQHGLGGSGSVQVRIPPELPEILKQFTKAAIKSQPPDVLAWSAAFFSALANGEPLPLRDAAANQPANLTPGLLRVLNRQLGPRIVCSVGTIATKWSNLALPRDQFDRLCQIGKFEDKVHWIHFFALACSSVSPNLTETMKLSCEILAPEGDGRIPMEMFFDIYQYLANIDGTVPPQNVKDLRSHLAPICAKQEGYISPKNFYNSSDCPCLQ